MRAARATGSHKDRLHRQSASCGRRGERVGPSAAPLRPDCSPAPADPPPIPPTVSHAYTYVYGCSCASLRPFVYVRLCVCGEGARAWDSCTTAALRLRPCSVLMSSTRLPNRSASSCDCACAPTRPVSTAAVWINATMYSVYVTVCVCVLCMCARVCIGNVVQSVCVCVCWW
jgi:hypothetical protein